jgi:hypothetical protein
MKHVYLLAAAIMALALIGCGGSGTGTDPVQPNDPSTPRIEAIVRVDRSNLRDPNKYTEAQLRDPFAIDPADLVDPTLLGIQDANNLQILESYYFQLVSYDQQGNRIVHDDVTWSISDTRYGNLGSNTGLYITDNAPTNSTQYVFAQRGEQRYQEQVQIRPRQVRLIGQMVSEGSERPVWNVQLAFYDNFGTRVASIRTAVDGTFRASIPTNTVSFTVIPETVPAGFYQSFTFNGLRYDAGRPGCRAPLPQMQEGTFVLNHLIRLTPRVEGQPTPPATGCTTNF